MRGKWIAIALVAAGLAGGREARCADKALANARGMDLAGQAVSPFSETNKGTVLIFLSVDCPISNTYAPELARLKKDFSSKGISFVAVYPNVEESDNDVREHIKKYSI